MLHLLRELRTRFINVQTFWQILLPCSEAAQSQKLNTKPPAAQTAGALAPCSNQDLFPISWAKGGRGGRCRYRIVYQ